MWWSINSKGGLKMIIESQDGTCKIDTEDIKYIRQEENLLVVVTTHGLVYKLGEYDNVPNALATLEYVMSDAGRDIYKMYEEG